MVDSTAQSQELSMKRRDTVISYYTLKDNVEKGCREITDVTLLFYCYSWATLCCSLFRIMLDGERERA